MIKKILFSLIVGLSFISFTSAYSQIDGLGMIEATIPDTAVIGNYAYVFSNNGNINTDGVGRFLYWKNSDGTNTYNYTFGWINGKLYFAGLFNGNVQLQGFVEKFCKGPSAVNCNSYNYNATDFYNTDMNITKVVVGNSASSSLSFAYANYPFRICYFNSLDDNYYCSQSAINNYGYGYSKLTGSLGFTTLSTIQNGNWGSSYFSPSKPVVPPYERGEGSYTNQDIIDGYNAMGLSDGFCYGGFPIDDIFNSGENPDSRVGYKWGSGASILDIWDNYKTAYNNDYISFLRTFYISYENKNYNAFYGYPKSLYSFFNQWSVIDLSSVGFNAYMSDFTITNIWEYCNLKFNSDPNATYSGNSWKPGFAFDNQDVVNNKGRFDFSGNSLYFSGSLSGFNSPSDFFGSLNSIFQNGLGGFNDIKEPLLPSYIIIFMLAIIFIRIISH